MAKRDRTPEPLHPVQSADEDAGLGEFMDTFQQPIRVGDATVIEVGELKARNKVIERLNADVQHYTQLRTIASLEKVNFIRSVGRRFGLDERDELNLNDETGIVTHTGRRRFVQSAEVTVTEEPNDEEGGAAGVPTEPNPDSGSPAAMAEAARSN